MGKKFRLPLLFLVMLLFAVPVHAAPALSKKTLSITIDEKYTLAVKGISSKTTVKWKSANKDIAKVTSRGVVTAVSAGKTTITATVAKKSLKCTVTVKRTPLVAMRRLNRYSYFRRYMTETEMTKAYNAAKKIVTPLRGKSRKNQVIGIAVGLRKLFDNGMEYTMRKKHYNDPYGYFVLKWASCAGCARATGLCLNMLGMKYEHVNENKYSHQWARVKVGSEYWICDAYGLYVGKEPGVRKHPYLR